MEGLEAVVIDYSKLIEDNWTFRIDSEYLQKRFLENIQVLKDCGFIKLDHYIDHMSGGATPLGANYAEEGVPFLRVQNIMQNYFNLNDVVFLNSKQDEEISRSRLKSRDVLLTITGVSYGKSATVNKSLIDSNINQHSVKISLKKDLNPYFLSTFLNSKYGKLQSDKNIVGVTRPALDYKVIRNFLIPKLNQEFQNEIEKVLHKAENLRKISLETYLKSEKILLKEGGLQDFSPAPESVNVKSFSTSFGNSGRLDAEYYQIKFDLLEELIIKTGSYSDLGSITSLISRGKQPNYISSNGLPVLNSKHIRENRISFNNTRIGSDDKESLIIQKNDVLINGTGVGTIGRTAPYLLDEPALPDNHVTIVRTDSISSLYLSVYLNSLAGQLQVEKYFKGSSGQIELYPDDISNFLIWVAPKEIQEEIEKLILKGFELENKSSQLLEIAKRAVEMAIEENESEAIAFITKESKHE